MAKFDFFISYSSKDSLWAEKLFASLNIAHSKVFLDKERLTAGDEWNKQLKDAVNNSEHMVVLWSSNAMASQWVFEEINSFRSKASKGLLIFICLDIDNQTHSQYQSVKYILEKNHPLNDPGTVDANLWIKTVNKVRKSVYEKNNCRPVKRVVFTLSAELLNQSNIDQLTKNSVQNNYGSNYADWKPFGNSQTIENIMNNFLYENINPETKMWNTGFYWDDMDWKSKDGALWLPKKDNNNDWIDKNVDAIKTEIEKLKSDLCVIILDPMALNHDLIKDRFQSAFNAGSENKSCLIMTLNPFQLSKELSNIRRQLKADAAGFYDRYYLPKMVSNESLSECYVNAIDDLEVARNLKINLRRYISPGDSGNGKNIIRNTFDA